MIFTIGISTQAQTGDVIELDSVEEAGGVYYSLLIGQIEKNKKVGVWHVYSYSSLDTNKYLSWKGLYIKDRLTHDEHYSLDGKTARELDKKGKVLIETEYRYGNKVWEYEFISSKKHSQRTYYHTGQVSGEGPVTLVEIAEGPNAGLQIFVKEGWWKFYDISGEVIDEKQYEVEEGLYKKVY